MLKKSLKDIRAWRSPDECGHLTQQKTASTALTVGPDTKRSETCITTPFQVLFPVYHQIEELST